MSLLYPLGLLGLIGIPLLILIYIIKNTYTEQTISSTYLWHLSERFLKRRLPISKINGLLSLILECVCIALISFAIAQPMFVVPNSASAYCFILDGSGSMNISVNGVTRFDTAKEKISEIIDKSMKGSTYTLIYVGDSTDTIYDSITNKEHALKTLSNMTVSYSESDLDEALEMVQLTFDVNPSLRTYLITDKEYSEIENVEFIRIEDNVKNYAVSDVDYVYTGTGYKVNGIVKSYGEDAELNIELYVNDSETPFDTVKVSVNEIKSEEEEDLPSGEEEENQDQSSEDKGNGVREASFEFNCEGLQGFQSFRLKIVEEDNLPLDNETVVYNLLHENISKTLLVSKYPSYLKAALISAGDTQLDVFDDAEVLDDPDASYKPESGYGLYIFDGYMPSELPTDGAVWFINPRSSLAGTNFSYQGDITMLSRASYSTSTATTVRNMLGGLAKNSFDLPKHSKCRLSGAFTTLLSCGSNPIVFAGSNVYGNREVVFAFDFKDSAAFILSPDCALLVSNMLNYSFPSVIDNSYYYSGETIQVNSVAEVESIQIVTPMGRETYLDTSETVSEYQLTEVGTYKIIVTKNDGETVNDYYVYSALPENERNPLITEDSFVLYGVATNNKFNGIYDDLLILFIILALIAAADYGVYCYEQYQLR